MQRADQVVGAADSKSGGPEISRSAGFVLSCHWFNSSAAIVNAIYILFSFYFFVLLLKHIYKI